MPNRHRPRPRTALHALTGSPSHVGREGVWLVAISAMDLFVTYRLLWQGGRFYESNPVAQWYFHRWNIAGMTGYKFGMVAFILVLGEIIERHRPGSGRAVVVFGAAAAAIVSAHGLRLLIHHG